MQVGGDIAYEIVSLVAEPNRLELVDLPYGKLYPCHMAREIIMPGLATARFDHRDPVAEERAAITKALVRIASNWQLTNQEAAALAGVNARTWSRFKSGSYSGTLNQDQRMRASLLVGLFKGLRLLFNGPLAYGWPKRPNKGFDGQTPVNLMIEGGIPEMVRLRRHIDALRGGV